jgi:hypothetical protein
VGSLGNTNGTGGPPGDAGDLRLGLFVSAPHARHPLISISQTIKPYTPLYTSVPLSTNTNTNTNTTTPRPHDATSPTPRHPPSTVHHPSPATSHHAIHHPPSPTPQRHVTTQRHATIQHGPPPCVYARPPFLSATPRQPATPAGAT